WPCQPWQAAQVPTAMRSAAARVVLSASSAWTEAAQRAATTAVTHHFTACALIYPLVLERQPQQQVRAVVGRGAAAKAVVIGATAVEGLVPRVLQRELYIQPRQIVELTDPTAG